METFGSPAIPDNMADGGGCLNLQFSNMEDHRWRLSMCNMGNQYGNKLFYHKNEERSLFS